MTKIDQLENHFAHCAKVNQDLEQDADKHPPLNMFCRTLQNHPENNGAFNCWMMSRICNGTPNYNPCKSPIEKTWDTDHRKHAMLWSFSSKAPKTIEIRAFLCGMHKKSIVWTMWYWAGCHQIWTKSTSGSIRFKGCNNSTCFAMMSRSLQHEEHLIVL